MIPARRGYSGPITIAAFNAENFYLLLDACYAPGEYRDLTEGAYMAMNASIFNPNKGRDKIAAIAETIKERDFDLVGMCEVGGLETLENFNRLYLDGRYECYLHQENSTRGIFVGALVKKGVFGSIGAVNVRGAFSRNLLKLELSLDGAGLSVYVLHLKSQYGDDLGIEKRMQEVRRLCSLVERRNCVVMGDFNGILIRGSQQFEFEPFLELPFRDVLEAMGVPADERYTHYYFGQKANRSQLDYIFCSNDIAVLDGGTIVGLEPLNREERERMPSDHLFVRATLMLPRPGRS